MRGRFLRQREQETDAPASRAIESWFMVWILGASLALPGAHALSRIVLHFAGEPTPDAGRLSWSVVVVAFFIAAAHVLLRPPRAALAASLTVSFLAAVALWGSQPARVAAPLSLLAVGVALTCTAAPLSRRVASVSGALRSRPVLALAWSVLGLLLVLQAARLGTFMADPSADWWLTTRDPLWAGHACLPAYIEAADLHRQGAPNVYDASYYAALNRDAHPRLTVKNMDAVVGDPFQYPPPFLVLPTLALAATDDYLDLRTIWYALQVAVFATIAVALARWVSAESGRAPLLLLPLVFLSVPGMQSFQFGQFHLVAVALAVGGMLAFEKKRNVAGGALLASAVLAKIFPGVLLIALLAGRRWKPLIWTVAFMIGISAAALLVLGPNPYAAFIQYQLPRLVDGRAFAFFDAWPEWRSWLLADNLAPGAVVEKLAALGAPFAAPALSATVARLFSVLVAILALVGARRRASRSDLVAGWLALLGLASLATPAAWGDYVPVTTVWMLTFLRADAHRGALKRLLLGACWVFCLLLPGVVPMPTLLPFPVAMVLSTAGTVLLVAVSAWAIVRRPHHEATA